MTRVWLLLVALLGNGCAFASRNVNVGTWRPQREIDTVVCLQPHGSACQKTLLAGRDTPARSFGGGLLALGAPGYAHASRSGGAVNAVALHNHVEYLRGRGGFALGGRVGLNVASDFGAGRRTTFVTAPVSALGYWGYPAFSLFAGVGYTPYASEKIRTDEAVATRSMGGPHWLVGGRIVASTRPSYSLSTSLELEQQFLKDVTLTAITASVGIHL